DNLRREDGAAACVFKDRKVLAHFVKHERAVEMRKCIAPARHLPFQRACELRHLHGHKLWVRRGAEIFVERRPYLMRGREMQKPVAHVVGRSREGFRAAKLLPFAGSKQLIDVTRHLIAAFCGISVTNSLSAWQK